MNQQESRLEQRKTELETKSIAFQRQCQRVALENLLVKTWRQDQESVSAAFSKWVRLVMVYDDDEKAAALQEAQVQLEESQLQVERERHEIQVMREQLVKQQEELVQKQENLEVESKRIKSQHQETQKQLKESKLQVERERHEIQVMREQLVQQQEELVQKQEKFGSRIEENKVAASRDSKTTKRIAAPSRTGTTRDSSHARATRQATRRTRPKAREFGSRIEENKVAAPRGSSTTERIAAPSRRERHEIQVMREQLVQQQEELVQKQETLEVESKRIKSQHESLQAAEAKLARDIVEFQQQKEALDATHEQNKLELQKERSKLDKDRATLAQLDKYLAAKDRKLAEQEKQRVHSTESSKDKSLDDKAAAALVVQQQQRQDELVRKEQSLLKLQESLCEKQEQLAFQQSQLEQSRQELQVQSKSLVVEQESTAITECWRPNWQSLAFLLAFEAWRNDSNNERRNLPGNDKLFIRKCKNARNASVIYKNGKRIRALR